jgi:uncharacterized C2H2 Zn-finger protein
VKVEVIESFIKQEEVFETVIKSEPEEEISESSGNSENDDSQSSYYPETSEVKKQTRTRNISTGNSLIEKISRPRHKRRTKEEMAESDMFCPHCDRLFKRKSLLTQHIEGVHERIKRFKCKFEGCEYACYQRSNVVKHQHSVHGLPGTKTYFCETCGAVYK